LNRQQQSRLQLLENQIRNQQHNRDGLANTQRRHVHRANSEPRFHVRRNNSNGSNTDRTNIRDTQQVNPTAFRVGQPVRVTNRITVSGRPGTEFDRYAVVTGVVVHRGTVRVFFASISGQTTTATRILPPLLVGTPEAMVAAEDAVDVLAAVAAAEGDPATMLGDEHPNKARHLLETSRA